MTKHYGPVFVDTNTILECHRIHGWKALTGGYKVSTVEKCVEETQNGLQNRDPLDWINEQELRTSLQAVHAVDDSKRAAGYIFEPHIMMLDHGERDLWCFLFDHPEAWIVCSPDSATYEVACRKKMTDRLVFLEKLLEEVGFSGRKELRANYKKQWHDQTVAEGRTRHGF
ncbi:hypothetical protein HFO55_05005 [Rhizobium leguminosarum]|uniref:hypothetical protein n=1 Tax=Rhizobium leguminosarum TaxID=384 RepID=UPI001C942BB7|nr:hypothetical protein [Rhizobium leguminosarum]MBY5566614.1 hypothetical protein [Rhizobium leguminosarum]MBY5573892.1 hypothetical protein [Rhizobium leguminosarum]